MKYDKKTVEKILEREKDLLLLFSEDERISYTVDEEGEEFSFDNKTRQLSVPLAFFNEHGSDETRLLYHLYSELALYPSYRQDPEYYENRLSYFSYEKETMVKCLQRRVKECEVENDKAFQVENILRYVEGELLSFLSELDFYTAVLLVERKAPLYGNPQIKGEIGEMLLDEDFLTEEMKSNKKHLNVSKALLISEFFSLKDIETKEIRLDFSSPVLQETKYDFLKENLVSCLNSVQSRDRLFRSFLFPLYLALYKEDKKHTLLSPTREENEWDNKRKKKNPFSSPSSRKALLHQLAKEKEAQSQILEETIKGDNDFSSYGIRESDQALFEHYENLVEKERKEMRDFWKHLLGSAYKEEKRKVNGLTKGKLDVPSLIKAYPSFVEAEEKNNYRNLPIFSLRKDVRVEKRLPENIDIIFAIDNSGSMRGEKLLFAREALTIVLLSLEDFRQYLLENNLRTHNRTRVRERTVLFGTSHQNILLYDDLGKERKAHIMLSVTSLKGEGGYTDDAALFNDIGKDLKENETMECRVKKRIRLLFIVTDGASSFPSAAKKALQTLKEKEMHISAIGISSQEDKQAEDVFNNLYGKDGVFLGKDIEKLPRELLTLLKKRMKDIFQSNGK